MLCVSPRDCSTLYENKSCRAWIPFDFSRVWEMGREIATHVGPRYEVVGALIERRDHRVLDNGVGQLQIKRIFDEVKHGLASGRVSPHVDIGLEVGYDSVRAEERLSLNGLKEHLHVRLEPL